MISQKDILDSPGEGRSDRDLVVPDRLARLPEDCRQGGRRDQRGHDLPGSQDSKPKQGYAYHVPYRSILPMREQCDNLLVPVALSCTHVGISSLRIEGAWMVIGQGAGVAAALSAKEGVAVQDLPYAKLRARLLTQGQVLDLSAEALDPRDLPGVIDDADAELEGTWQRSANFKPHVGSGYIHDNKQGDGQSWAIFRYRAPVSGEYDLSHGLFRSSDTRHQRACCHYQRIHRKTHHRRPDPAVASSRALPGRWQSPSAGFGPGSLMKITNHETNGFVIVDALRLHRANKSAKRGATSDTPTPSPHRE